MFGIFGKKQKPRSVLDEFVSTMYGDPPPDRQADLSQAISLANGLLMNLIDTQQVSRQAEVLYNGPIPYTTHDLAVAVALYFFKQAENTRQLATAQLFARMEVVEWHKQGLVNMMLMMSFEEVLYKLYKPVMPNL